MNRCQPLHKLVPAALHHCAFHTSSFQPTTGLHLLHIVPDRKTNGRLPQAGRQRSKRRTKTQPTWSPLALAFGVFIIINIAKTSLMYIHLNTAYCCRVSTRACRP
jgi:hypothetical protein